jgi:hypothetical protein
MVAEGGCLLRREAERTRREAQSIDFELARSEIEDNCRRRTEGQSIVVEL